MLVSFEEARAHLRVDDCYPTEQIAPYLLAAERFAVEFLNRRLYASEAQRAEAVATVPQALAAASAAYAAAMQSATALPIGIERDAALQHATWVYEAAKTAALEIRRSMVVDDLIKAAILLILGHLHENREEVVTGTTATTLPIGAKALLSPYRVGLGV
ncbi:head-tail connector protein [Variovorax sp. UMC13]|uniref:head-tail connector protein n=1 Tax=Variovorax sp. UMC13 TaxID=1862326 RepID=UPI0016010554|nr:head-tail connector protein [Variovorax sp. UMC13]